MCVSSREYVESSPIGNWRQSRDTVVRAVTRHVAALAGVGSKAVPRVINGEPNVSELTAAKFCAAAHRAIVSVFLRRRVDRLILTTASKSQAYLLPEPERVTPLVFVDREPVGIEADSVVSDNAIGSSSATRRLIERGHRRIASWATTRRSQRRGSKKGLSGRIGSCGYLDERCRHSRGIEQRRKGPNGGDRPARQRERANGDLQQSGPRHHRTHLHRADETNPAGVG